jgi:hypothetical protein
MLYQLSYIPDGTVIRLRDCAGHPSTALRMTPENEGVALCGMKEGPGAAAVRPMGA